MCRRIGGAPHQDEPRKQPRYFYLPDGDEERLNALHRRLLIAFGELGLADVVVAEERRAGRRALVRSFTDAV